MIPLFQEVKGESVKFVKVFRVIHYASICFEAVLQVTVFQQCTLSLTKKLSDASKSTFPKPTGIMDVKVQWLIKIIA